MVWIIGILAVAALGVAAFVSTGQFGGLAPLVHDDPVPAVPEGQLLSAHDVESARFSYAWRGYKPEQVDALLARVAQQLPANSGAAATVPAQNKE